MTSTCMFGLCGPEWALDLLSETPSENTDLYLSVVCCGAQHTPLGRYQPFNMTLDTVMTKKNQPLLLEALDSLLAFTDSSGNVPKRELRIFWSNYSYKYFETLEKKFYFTAML